MRKHKSKTPKNKKKEGKNAQNKKKEFLIFIFLNKILYTWDKLPQEVIFLCTQTKNHF